MATHSQIRVHLLHSMEEVAPFREEINRVNLRSRQQCPLSTFEYIDDYVRHNEYFPNGGGREIWFLAAFEGERLLGYLPLRRTFEPVFGKPRPRLDFLVTHETDRPHLVAAPEHEKLCAELFLGELVARKDDWTFLELKDQDAQSVFSSIPRDIDLSGHYLRRFENSPNATIRMCWPTLADYYNSLSAHMRTNLRRQIRSLMAAGNIQYVSSSDPALLPELFEAYLSIEPRSWKVAGGAAISRHPERVRHFRHLLSPDQPIRTTIQLVFFNHLPIVGSINAGFGKTLYLLETAYDAALGHLGPGALMVFLAVRQAVEERYELCNMLTNFGYFKSRWGADIIPTESFQLYRIGSRHFYKAILGDFKRDVLPPAPDAKPGSRADAAEERKADDEAGKRLRQAAQLSKEALLSLGERAVRSGGEHLGPRELRLLMPFPMPGQPDETSTPPAKAAPKPAANAAEKAKRVKYS